MTTRLFISTDAGLAHSGATPVYGAVGSLKTILDKIFINGFNSGSCTITRSGTTATVNRVGHGYLQTHTGTYPRPDQHVTIAGAVQPEYNGSFPITYIDADNFSFQVSGSPATPATGAITCKTSPLAGWSQPFVSGNTAVYRAGSGNRHYLRVDDTGTTLARIVAYESMTDVNTGTSAFPTAVQFSGGLYWPKSSTADSSNMRDFVMIADETYFFIVMNPDSTGLTGQPVAFGEIESFKPGDAYHSVILGGGTNNPISSSSFSVPQTALTTGGIGSYMARSHTQVGGSVVLGKHIDAVKGSNSSIGGSGNSMVYPSGMDGGLWLTPIWIHESVAGLPRGLFPGVWAPLHNRPFSNGDNFDGVGNLAGKRFVVANIYNGGQLHLEYSNTW
jgi:hypothetical protein